ncbi:MAG: sugar ABC transporter permease [Sphaerochaetaceae bacterium]|nr:sugar ABC transporter permease [Sphaerochaetaceae bacterium]MDC7237478.1 sugar ABC transporter permease [Sphaerochaetaceae bacterium]
MKNKIPKGTIAKNRERWAYLFISVPVLFYILVRFIPTIYAFYLSFTDWDIISASANWIGFSNYKRLFSDKLFYKTLSNTFYYVIYGLPLSLLFGFILAYNIEKIKIGSGLFKTVYFMPYITSMVAVAWVWRWLFQPAPIGIFNNILISMGLPMQEFLNSVEQSKGCILAATIWSGVGFQMIIFMAGMKGISKQYYEAAKIDGASSFNELRYITLPLLRNSFIFLLITGTIRFLRIFTQVVNMTRNSAGGPLNSSKPLVLYIYDNAFRSFDMGYASALTVILFLIILLITLIQMRVTRDER